MTKRFNLRYYDKNILWRSGIYVEDFNKWEPRGSIYDVLQGRVWAIQNLAPRHTIKDENEKTTI